MAKQLAKIRHWRTVNFFTTLDNHQFHSIVAVVAVVAVVVVVTVLVTVVVVVVVACDTRQTTNQDT